jgi:hypothetical protein
MVVLVVISAASAIGIVIYIFGKAIFYILGVAAVAGVVYFLYEKIVEVFVGLFLILGGIIAKGSVESRILPWYLSILIWGLIVGLTIAPLLVIVDVKKSKKTLNDRI